MATITFTGPNGETITATDNSEEVAGSIKEALGRALEKVGLLAEGHAKALCPVDTGRLRNSITHITRPSEKAVYIGTNVEYAPYVEMGTAHQAAQPFLVPAATEKFWSSVDLTGNQTERGSAFSHMTSCSSSMRRMKPITWGRDFHTMRRMRWPVQMGIIIRMRSPNGKTAGNDLVRTRSINR